MTFDNQTSFTNQTVQTIKNLFSQINNNNNTPLHIVLSGGTTPIPIYKRFEELKMDWSNVHFWLADERCVPGNHPDSNERAIREALGSEILTQAVFHSIPEGNATEMAFSYSEMLQNVPDFDLSILGIGEDGHTASLFPGNDLGESCDSPDAIPVLNSPKPPKERVSLSLNRINRSRHILFLAKGESKRMFVESVSKSDAKYPAGMVQGIETREIFYCL